MLYVVTDPRSPETIKRTIVHLNVGGEWAPFPNHNIYSGTAWHYTDASATLGIVHCGEIWASSSLMMNDAGELDYAIGQIRASYADWHGQGHQGAHVAVEAGLGSLEEDLYANPPFIVSASKSDRLLNQWASYGAVSGYAIGFDAKTLLMPKHLVAPLVEAGSANGRLSNHGWREVIYEPIRQAEHIRATLDAMVSSSGVIARALDAENGQTSLITSTNLALLATTLKDSAFAAEQEVRYTLQLTDDMTTEYRATQRGIVPFIRLVGTELNDGEVRLSSSMPVQSITVGPPTGSEKRRISSLISLRDAENHSFSVGSAGIPYLP